MEPLNLMVSLSFFGNERNRADIASNGARRTADADGGVAPASTRARNRSGAVSAPTGARRAAGAGGGGAEPASSGAGRTGGARRVVQWVRTVGAR
jgi:hypothetical protein